MAVSSIAVPPDPRRDARAAALVDSVARWPLFVLRQPYGAFPAGTIFRRAPSSKGDGTFYLVNAVACECPDYQHSGAICKHVRAVVLFERQAQPIRTVRARYDDLFPACPCGDIADARDGLCDRCASDREWQQRMAGRRELLANGRAGTDVIPLNIPA
jgi:hypothetical protein